MARWKASYTCTRGKLKFYSLAETKASAVKAMQTIDTHLRLSFTFPPVVGIELLRPHDLRQLPHYRSDQLSFVPTSRRGEKPERRDGVVAWQPSVIFRLKVLHHNSHGLQQAPSQHCRSTSFPQIAVVAVHGPPEREHEWSPRTPSVVYQRVFHSQRGELRREYQCDQVEAH